MTCDVAVLEAINLLKHAINPVTVAAALGEGGGRGGLSGGKFGAAGSIVIKAINVTSGTSIFGGTPMYEIHALNSRILRQSLARDPGIEPLSATASLAAAARCFKCMVAVSMSALERWDTCGNCK